MIPTFLLSVVPVLAAPGACAPAPAAVLPQDEQQEEKKTIDHQARMTAAGDDVAQLWALVEELDELDMNAESREVCKRILELDASHEAAHKKLRHHFYDDQWFESYTALSKYRREEAKRMLDEHGLVRFRDEWVPQTDVVYLRMGWTKDENDQWVSPHVIERVKMEAKYVEEGRQQRPEDGAWILPEDFDKWREGLFLCGDQWVGLEEAQTYHGQIGQWWTWMGNYFVCLSTLDYEGTKWASWWADQTYQDLVRAVGLKPQTKPEFVVLNGIPQYNVFASGDQAAGLAPTEGTGFSSLHYAYVADAWFDPTVQPPVFRGTGVCYWDQNDEALKGYGQFAVRHAAAQAYLESIDPSWETISQAIANPGGAGQGLIASFWNEKIIPGWLRYGISSYCERYFRDRNVGQDGNPWWARDWAMQNIRAAGDIRPLEELFQFNLDLNDIPGSTQMINEAGLIVSFILDSGDSDVAEKHAAFKAALEKGEGTEEAVQALQQAIIDNERSLRNYAQI